MPNARGRTGSAQAFIDYYYVKDTPLYLYYPTRQGPVARGLCKTRRI